MDCTRIKELLSPYIDGELSDHEAQEVRRHLDECSKCQQEYEQLKKIIYALKKFDAPKPPEGYKQDIKAKLIQYINGRRRSTVAGAAALIAAALIIFISISSLGIGRLQTAQQRSNMGAHDTVALQSAGAIPDRQSSNTGGANDSAATSSRVSGESVSPELADKGFNTAETPKEGASSSGDQASTDSADKTAALDIAQADAQQRKIIKSAYLSIETEQFDRTVNSVIGRATALGGYVSNSEYNNQQGEGKRTAHIEVKVPQQSFEQYLNDTGKDGRIVQDRRTGQDVTGEYMDTETRVKMLKIKEDKLMTLLSQAKTLQDMFTIQDQLTNTQIEIERLTGELKRWDDLVNYSTAVIDVYEVTKLEPKPVENPNIGQRISSAFMNSLKALEKFIEGFVVFIFGALPYLALIGVIAWGVMAFIKRKK